VAQSLRLTVNRSAGSNSLSVWLAEMGDHHRTPLHWHTEEVLVFLEVDGDGFARVGDEEYKIETQTSVVVPAGTIHAFGLRNGAVLKSVSILPDADAMPGHRLLEKGEESIEMPELKRNDLRSKFQSGHQEWVCSEWICLVASASTWIMVQIGSNWY
jgi:quercetin dioxygenase-like cupin family protein